MAVKVWGDIGHLAVHFNTASTTRHTPGRARRSLSIPSGMRYLTVPFVICVSALAAQPTIGTDQFFQVGHGYLRHSYDILPNIAADLINADSADYAIDLDWVGSAPLYTSDSIVCTVPSGIYPYHPNDYDTANVQVTFRDLELNGVRTHLFLVRDASVEYVGGQPFGTGDTGDDLVFQRYPDQVFETVLIPGIELGTTWSGPIDGQFLDASGSDDHFLNGTSTTTADGSGSITLPDGTYLPHTLRLRTVREYMDSNALFGDTPRQDTLYTWWVDNWDGPLMTLPIGDYGLMHGLVSPLPFTLYGRLGVVQPTAVNELTAIAARLGPIPCSDRLVVHDAPNTTYRVVDASGRPVMHGTLSGGIVDVQHLAPGSYTLQLLTEPGRPSRFVVAR
jgi:hypothetical protein